MKSPLWVWNSFGKKKFYALGHSAGRNYSPLEKSRFLLINISGKEMDKGHHLLKRTFVELQCSLFVAIFVDPVVTWE